MGKQFWCELEVIDAKSAKKYHGLPLIYAMLTSLTVNFSILFSRTNDNISLYHNNLHPIVKISFEYNSITETEVLVILSGVKSNANEFTTC